MKKVYFKKHLTESQLQSIQAHIVPSHLQTNIGLGKKVNHSCAVVFLDLCNFTNISRSISTDKILEILQTLFKKVSENINSHNGMIDKYPGDGVVAFFPRDYSDDMEASYIESALDSITEIMYWFYNHMRYWFDLPKPSHELELSVGLDAGYISIAHVGSPIHSELILLGDEVNCASKCQAAAEKKEVVVGQDAGKEIRSIYSGYFSTGPSIGVVYKKNNERYLSYRFDWENFAENSGWIGKS